MFFHKNLEHNIVLRRAEYAILVGTQTITLTLDLTPQLVLSFHLSPLQQNRLAYKQRTETAIQDKRQT